MKKKEIVDRLIGKQLNKKQQEELIDMLINKKISVDIDKKQEQKLTFGDKMADKISEIVGSWLFITIFIVFLALWMLLNLYFLKHKIDPYPFILLNLVLSCIAAIQAPIIMMSQNRAAKKESIRSQNDYIVDLKSELMLEELHKKINKIIRNQNKIMKKETKKSL